MPAKYRCVWDEWESPIGRLLFVATDQGLLRLDFATESSVDELTTSLNKKLALASLEHHPQELAPYIRQMAQFFQQERTAFTLPIQLVGTSFQIQVWHELLRIPYGEVRSYLQVARGIGNPKAVRAVGGANNRNPIAIIVPCHRVIGANGSMVGYGGGLHRKQALLELEGQMIEQTVTD